MRCPLLAAVGMILMVELVALSSTRGDDPLPRLRLPGRAVQPAASSTSALSDDEALRKAGLSAGDGEKLIQYLRLRTLSDTEQGKISEIIKRFGVDDFDERLKASEEVLGFGPAAIGPLRKTAEESGGDPEVIFRARIALKKLETVPHSEVAAAAVRAVVKLKPEGAAGALIGFLPVADTEVVADIIRRALIELAVRDGKADPALVAALSDKLPIRRAAAFVALSEGGPASERIRVRDAYPRLREAVLKEADTASRFIGLWSLALTTREKEYIPELIALIPKLPRGRIWQLEDLLLLMAGSHPKDGRFLKSPESLLRARDAWLGWWKDKGPGFDLVKFDYKPRVAGFTDIIELDSRGYGQSRIVCLGPDLKEKWELTRVNYPSNLAVADNGNLWVVETNSNRIAEFDVNTGNVLKTRTGVQQPINVELLPDGGMIVISHHQIMEWDKDGKEKWNYARQNYDIRGGCRLTNGEILFVIYTNQGENAFRLTATGKDANPKNDPKRKLQFGRIQQPQSMHAFAEDKVLVCEYDRVAEYDLKTSKQTWNYKTQTNAVSCQRLPNGNTLISIQNQNRLIEVDPSGEIVWEYAAKDGLRVGRAQRR